MYINNLIENHKYIKLITLDFFYYLLLYNLGLILLYGTNVPIYFEIWILVFILCFIKSIVYHFLKSNLKSDTFANILIFLIVVAILFFSRFIFDKSFLPHNLYVNWFIVVSINGIIYLLLKKMYGDLSQQ